MQQRLLIPIIVGGLLLVLAIGFVVFNSSDDVASKGAQNGQETVIQVTPDIGSGANADLTITQKSSNADLQAEAGNTAKIETEEQLIPTPVLKTETAPKDTPKNVTEAAPEATPKNVTEAAPKDTAELVSNDKVEATSASKIQPSDDDSMSDDSTNDNNLIIDNTENDDNLTLAVEEVEAEPVFSITVARVDPDGSAIFAGVAEAEATIQLQDGRTVLDTTTADKNGEWVSVPATKLSAGPHLIILTMRTKDGRVATANRSLVVEISEAKTEKPLVALVPQDDTTTPILLQSPDAAADIEVIEEDVAVLEVPALDPSITIQSLSIEPDEGLRVIGRYSAGKGVKGRLGDRMLSDARLEADGRWSALANIKGLSDTPQLLEIQLLDANSGIVARASLSLDKNNLSADLDKSEMVVVQKGDALWKIAYRSYGKGIRYVEIARRNQDQISDPNLIFPNQIFVVPK